MKIRRPYTAQHASILLWMLRAPRRGFTAADLAKGMNVEAEHGTERRLTNVTNDNPLVTAKIALAHLYETPRYYQKLTRARLNPSR